MWCGCMYVFLWLFGLLGPGSNGSVQVSDRDSRLRSPAVERERLLKKLHSVSGRGDSWRSSETMEGGGGWDER